MKLRYEHKYETPAEAPTAAIRIKEEYHHGATVIDGCFQSARPPVLVHVFASIASILS